MSFLVPVLYTEEAAERQICEKAFSQENFTGNNTELKGKYMKIYVFVWVLQNSSEQLFYK